MNNTVLVGRLTKDPEISDGENGKRKGIVNVAVTRNYKNSDGVYETDFIKCILWNNVASSTAEYCKKGDIVGIKGRLENNRYINDEGEEKFYTDVVVDKITFLTSKREHYVDNSIEFEN